MDINTFISDFSELFEETEVSIITSSTIYKNLDEWDSLIAFSLIAMAKIKYGKTLTGTDIRGCSTVEDLFKLLETK